MDENVVEEFMRLGEEGSGSYSLSKEAGLAPGKAEPQEPGWYTYSGGAQNMIFLRAPRIGGRPRVEDLTRAGVVPVDTGDRAVVEDREPERECKKRFAEDDLPQACYRLGCYVVATGEPVGTVGT